MSLPAAGRRISSFVEQPAPLLDDGRSILSATEAGGTADVLREALL